VHPDAKQNSLSFFKMLRIRMKLGFMAWQKHVKPRQLMIIAIMQTIIDKITVAIKEVQDELPKDQDGIHTISVD